MVNRVKAEISPRNLTLTPNPDGTAVVDASGSSFEVTITNESQEFASFQLELSTPGVDSDSVVEWYHVEPNVCAKKPPGAVTTFRVAVVRSPIPVYDTTIDLLVKVFSIEFRNLSNTQKISLTIRKPQQPLNLVLPNKAFKGAPGDRVEIPVLVYNYSPTAIEVTLRCSGLEQAWLGQGAEQQLRVEPGYPTEAIFLCQLPETPNLLQQSLPFSIAALSAMRGRVPTEKGTLAVLPLGTVEFQCTPKQQQMPPRGLFHHWFSTRWFSHPQHTGIATYQLTLNNASNTLQQVRYNINEFNQQRLQFTLPEPLMLPPGRDSTLPLTVNHRRHWVGFTRRFRFDVEADVFEPISGDRSTRIHAVPSRQTLELHVLPIVSPVVLLAGGVLLLALLWLYQLLNPPVQHQAAVNAVRLDGNAGNVFSGSSDQTILRWQVDNDSWLPMIRRLKYEHPVTQALLGKAVRVIRLSPIDNNVIAAGLENGEIQLLDVLGNQVREPLFQDNDRVFDLNFTPDARYLFSGHGSSRVRQWDLKSNRKQPFSIITTNFAITSLAVSQVPADPFVMIAGRFNQLRLWNWEQQRVYAVPYSVEATVPYSRTFQPVFGQNHYIESVAIAHTILATADNQGYITVWNWQQRQCTAPPQGKAIKAQTIIATEADGSQTLQQVGECIMPIVDQWADGHGGKPVRSVAITPDGLYLASVGDDGQVKLWFLDQGKRSTKWKDGKVLQQFPGSRLRSVDLRDSKNSGGYIFVTSDAPNNQVRLYREPMNAHASQ